MTDEELMRVDELLERSPGMWGPERVRELRQHITGQSAEIERLKADVDRLTKERDAALASATRGWEVADAFHVQKAELAHLTPSGQVAEDVEILSRSIAWSDGCCGRPPCVDQGEEALSHLAAKAQGYEAATARAVGLAKRVDAVAAERDTAVADNAALLWLIPSPTYREIPDCWCSLRDGPTPHEGYCLRLKEITSSPHPGAALLEQMQDHEEALTMALHVLEEYEKQASMTHVIILATDGIGVLKALVERLRKATSSSTVR